MQNNSEISLDIPARFDQLELLRNHIENIIQTATPHLTAEEVHLLTYNTQLAVNEIGTNIIEHAYAGVIDRDTARVIVRLCVLPSPLQLEIRMHDTGHSFEYDPTREPLFDTVPERGYGLFLARQLLDHIEYIPKPNANTWHLIKQLS